ncbi:MAG: hypothetical protein J6Y41_04460, partial [Bacteroidaceae bacterium]|nr:hypothetical protein [Bacteroidaceae bacterium]
MRKFIFSLKTLVMSLALVVGGSAWAQITGLPFVADFSSGEIAPFTGGSGAFVATVNDGSDAKVIAANNGEAYAQFDAPYVISNMEEVTVSFQMLNGWLGSGAGNKFAILNSDGVALAAVVYDNKSCNFSEVILDNTMAEDFTAFNGQSSAGAKGANGYDNGKGQGFKLNTAETLYNPVVTIKINSFGGISVSIVGGNNNNNVTYSRAAQPGTKLDLDKVYITNASNNGDRATGYYDLKITSKSMIKYSNDYSDDVVTWTSATGGRYTPIIQDGYLTVNQDERNNNGTTITSTETEGKVAAGENFTMSCRVKLGASTNQTATAFNIYDAANSAAILSIAEVVTNATAWTINSGTQTATVSAGGGKAIDELAWIDVKVTSIAGGKTYLTLKDADGNIIDGFDKKDIPTLSTEGGLGKMNFVTSRYNANFAIDDIIVRDVVESEDIPATPIYTYTVKYVDQDNFEFKEPAKREEYEGVELAITDEDKETVIDGSIKYTYVSDDAAGQTAASDGSTVITVTFNKTTVTDYTVNFLDTSNGEIKAAVVHKNVLVGTEVSATQGELSKILKEGVFYEYASGNEPITLVEDAAANVINLYFAPVEGVTGYFFNNYEDKTVDWTTATGGRYDPVAVDGSKIADRGTTERKPVVDPETGEPQVDPETGEPMYEEVPGLSIPFGNKTYFLSVNQANRNNNGAAVNKASLAIEQADFTFEAKVLLGSSNNQNGTNLLIKNFAGDANIFKIAQKAEGNTTSWIINDDAENFTVVLPNSGTFAGTDNNNLTNYDWYNLKVTVYNGITFVTITDKEGTAILDKAQVPTQATSYGVGAMQFNSSRYNANLGLDDVTVRSVVTSEDVPAGAEFVAVKINYVDEAGTPLKESAEVNFQVGQPIVLNSAFTADFKVDAEGNVWTAESESAPVTKYIYVSDNSDEVEVALDAQVNIVFRGVASRRVALRYQYQTVDGDMKTKDAAGANLPFFYDSNKTGDVLFEGDELTFYYPFYLLVDGLLYQSTGNNSSGADKATLVVEPGTSTQVKSPVTWTPALEEEEQIDNAIFAQESENIEGMTVVKDGYTQIRMANGAAGSAIGGNVLITTLEPGTYTITSATRSGLTNFLAGDEVVFSVESSGTVVTSTSGEFTVDVATPLYIEEQSAISKYSDYVLVRQLSSIASYPITVADEIENGTVEIPTAAAAGAVIKPVLTADAGYELESSEITVKDAEGAEVTVADGAFTMPASAVTVTVKATFVPKKIYIETDLTSQFLALTDKSTWTSETSSGVGIAEWAAPQVTVAGNKYYMIENYVEGQDKKLATGGVMYNTIKGLTPGLYTIELYGSAALTPGRSDMTTDFEEGDDASLHAVYLYAEAGGNKTQKYIPCLIESNFNNRGGEESIPTASLDNVEVGEDGTIKIGIYKEVGLTNWHIVQLKSVTAKILASDLLEAAVVAAGMIDDDDVPEALYREIQETIATYNKAYDTAEEYLTAVEALKAVVAKAEAYAPLAEAIEAGEDIKENVSKESAIAEYDEAIAPIISAYEAVAVEDIPAATVRVAAANVTLAKVQDAPNSDLTIVAENSEWINRSGTYAGDCAERWNGSAYEAGKVLYQRIEGLIPNATYEVQFLAVANVAWISAATGEGIAQVFANDAAKDIEVYDQTGCDPTQYKHTLQATADAEGVFEYGLQNVATGGNWYVAKAVALTFKGASYAISYAESMVGGNVYGPAEAVEGDEVALTVTPAEGYELASIAVTNEAGEE